MAKLLQDLIALLAGIYLVSVPPGERPSAGRYAVRGMKDTSIPRPTAAMSVPRRVGRGR